METFIPEIDNRFCCIVDWNKPALAACIASYLARPGVYIPFFECPGVLIRKLTPDDSETEEYSLNSSNVRQFSVLTGNAIRRAGGCEYLVLAGLSDGQKSFLTFLNDYNTIDITDSSMVDFYLSEFARDKTDYAECPEEEVEEGLFRALQLNAKLKIVAGAALVVPEPKKQEGIIVVEQSDSVASIIAVNYAFAVYFDLKAVPVLQRDEPYEKKYLIEEWKNGSPTAYGELSTTINERLAGIDFTGYRYASFFTNGLPYALFVPDPVVCTQVHLRFRPDFFVFNNLYFEQKQLIPSAVVFSPSFFSNEETSSAIAALKKQQYYVRELVGKEASVFNIDMHVKEFPFGILHICSHGGEVPGYLLKESFTDRDGNTHVVEFDRVVSFAPSRGKPLIPVQTKDIWRKFDGLVWRSPALRALQIPAYVFTDMMLSVGHDIDKHAPYTNKKENIPDSCSIKCADFIYQAMFEVIAGGHVSPVVFNNSCWSWSGVSDSFLNAGARGYIGTLWNIDNSVATEAAKIFYEELFSTTIARALHSASGCAKGSTSENVYLYWGLHFTSVKSGAGAAKSRETITRYLLRKFDYWTSAIGRETDEKMRERLKDLQDWIGKQLFYFKQDYIKLRNEWIKQNKKQNP